MQRPDVRKNLRRGVYIVPTLFTILNIFFGFRSIVNSLRAREAMTRGTHRSGHRTRSRSPAFRC